MRLCTQYALSALVAVATTAAWPARADDKPNPKADSKKACVDAYGQAQTLRDAHKLRDAREQLRICSQATCTAFIVKDCTEWLVDVEGRIPSIVLSAKDGPGQSIADVAVSMDGVPIAQKLDGQSIEVNPGAHTFSFVANDGTRVDLPFTVLEGQRTQSVTVTLTTAAIVPPPKLVLDQPKSPPPVDFWSTPRKFGVGLGAAGVMGVVVGSIFGLLATSAANSQKMDCASATNCSNHPAALSNHSSAANDSTISTVAFIAGGALTASGAVLFFVAGSHGEPRPSSSAVTVLPSAGPTGGGLWISKVF